MFCDFCKCKACQNGEIYLLHAKTLTGKWVCDVCYAYDICIVAKRKIGELGGPCEANEQCDHKPKLFKPIEWIKFEEKEK